jgi:hypothetical protein
MSVRWIADIDDDKSVIYDSVTDTAFGPVFYTADGAQEFLTWYGERTPDLRMLSHDAICVLVQQCERENDAEQTPLPFPEIPF